MKLSRSNKATTRPLRLTSPRFFSALVRFIFSFSSLPLSEASTVVPGKNAKGLDCLRGILGVQKCTFKGQYFEADPCRNFFRAST